MASTYSCNPLGLQVNSAHSRGLSCASRYRYAISSGVSSKTDELHFSQLIVRNVSEYVSLIALMIMELVSGSYMPNRQQGLFCFMVFSFPQILSTIKQINDGCKHIVIVGL